MSRRQAHEPAPGMLTLSPDPAAVRTARSYVRTHLNGCGLAPDTIDTAVLLTSETVTNALTHGRSEARLRIAVKGDQVRIEVGDDNSRHPKRAQPDTDALDGRGVAILELLAADWGVRDDAFGKTVWFEVGN